MRRSGSRYLPITWLYVAGKKYDRQHKQWFWDLCCALYTLNEGLTSPKVSGVGFSEFIGFYRQLFPNMALHGTSWHFVALIESEKRIWFLLFNKKISEG